MGEKDIKKIKFYKSKEDRIAQYSGDDRVISSHDFLKELEEKKGKDIWKLKSKLPTFDKLTEGFETGELIVVSGYTKHGKTSFCQSLTVNFAEEDIKSLWFSYEVTPKQFFTKFRELPLFYLPRELKGSALDWIEDRILESKIKYDTRVIFLDHLHFLVDLMKSRHPSLAIGSVMRSLKKMAIDHNLVIFLIAHTSMPRGNQSPGLDAIRDSSFITQESDSAIVIQRIKDKKGVYGNEAWLTILTHRRMGVMGKSIKLIYLNKQFHEIDLRETE